MFRREWRQQVLLLALLGLAVAGATVGESLAYSVAPSTAGELGTASYRLHLRDRGAGTLPADIAAARQWFGTAEVITSRALPVPGAIQPIDLRAQDPAGPYGKPMLRLLGGRYPTGDAELALTRSVARTLGVSVGGSVTVDGQSRTVVGLVENPNDLSQSFALEAPSNVVRAQSAIVLLRADEQRLRGFRTTDGSGALIERRSEMNRGAAAVLGLGVATVVLLLISLIAAASFAVLAQRRLRQLGMLAAIGATQKHLRLVMLVHGAAVGAAAAVAGTTIGVATWFVAAPNLEASANHRIDRVDLPWAVLGLGMVLALALSAAAAWWPARAVARIPVTFALAARAPGPRAVHRSALAAGVLLVAGFAGITLGIDPVKDHVNSFLLLGGIVALSVGLVMAGPVAIRVVAGVARRAPVAVRLALRDLGRYQARSSAALAAISLALAIAVTVVVAASAAVRSAAEGNLSDRQVLVRLGTDNMVVPERTAAELAARRSDVDRLAATLGHAAVVPLDVPVGGNDRETTRGQVVRPAVSVARRVSPSTLRFVGALYVATPEVLAHLGLADRPLDPSIDVLTAETGDLAFVGGPRQEFTAPRIQALALPTYSSGPSSLITLAGLARAGWQAQPAGWLVETASPLTGAQLKVAREAAAAAGLTVETRDRQRSLATIRSAATAAGALLALGVLAMTVGLIRSESAGDLRTLAAAGATSKVRRTITATTAAALGLLGVVLGTATAYLGMIAGYLGRTSSLGRVPVLHLAITIVGVPAAAAVAGWLLAGREPPAISRAAFD